MRAGEVPDRPNRLHGISRDESTLEFAFPKEWRAALVESEGGPPRDTIRGRRSVAPTSGRGDFNPCGRLVNVSFVYPAVRWDGGPVQGWTVMGLLRERRELLRNHAIQARRRLANRTKKSNLPGVAFDAEERDAVRASWHGSTELLALLFAPPDSPAMRVLHSRREYFDYRTGDKWSLFFPGHYESGATTRLRRDPFIGRPRPTGSWSFDAAGFDDIRRHVADQTAGRWQYSGNTDLVLAGAWLPEEGEIAIDWGSTISGELKDSGDAGSRRSLGAAIESITRNFDQELDPMNGIAAFLAGRERPSHVVMRDATIQVFTAIAAALILHGLHLG